MAIDAPSGDEIGWAAGSEITNFQSKTLGRTFDVVYFVPEVHVLGGKAAGNAAGAGLAAPMVANAAEIAGSPLPAHPGPSPFADIAPSDPDFATIMAAYGAGLVSGVTGPDGTMILDPYASATRGQAAKVVDGLLGVIHGTAQR